MKNWATLEANETRLMTKHYTKGRSGRKSNKVIIHHNAGNLTIKSILDVWQTRQASAHYQVDARVAGAALRPLAPEVDLFELVSETRVVEQELTGEFLEECALLSLACRARTVLVQEHIQCAG